MGYLSALDMAGQTKGMLGRIQAMEWHLGSNHFPPVPLSMVTCSLKAVDAGVEEDYDRLIELPDGVTYKDADKAPAWAIIEQHHLQAFIDAAEVDPSEHEFVGSDDE